jgi:3-methyl-2-oxobutanoate hydroxymethyltransferase
MLMSSESAPPLTLERLRRMKREGERIACLTAYDFSFARILDEAGVDLVLVGDSLGMVVGGHPTTVPVTVDDMVYHARAVARGCRRPVLVVDLPFLSYATPERALRSAARLMQDGGAQMVKLEGGETQLETVRTLARQGVPVCAHLGLQPQSVHKLGGYRVQGREPAVARQMAADARALEQAGADLLVLESVPSDLAGSITAALSIPVIGIGAGAACDGQVLVLYDALGITSGRIPRFARSFLTDGRDVRGAVRAYVEAVKGGAFPAAEHEFH